VHDCELLGECDGENPSASVAACTPGETEEAGCGVCGVQSRTCADDSTWSPWSECIDPKPGCNPCEEPTWENAINDIMMRRCVRCHWECRSYETLMPWVEDGSLEWYTEQGHYISGEDKATLLRWIEIGAPETDCDVQ